MARKHAELSIGRRCTSIDPAVRCGSTSESAATATDRAISPCSVNMRSH